MIGENKILGAKLRFEKDGNDSLSHEYKYIIQVLFRNSINLLISRILNNNEKKK